MYTNIRQVTEEAGLSCEESSSDSDCDDHYGQSHPCPEEGMPKNGGPETSALPQGAECGEEGRAAQQRVRPKEATGAGPSALFKATVRAYAEEFGRLPPAELWGSPGQGCVAVLPPKDLRPGAKTIGMGVVFFLVAFR